MAGDVQRRERKIVSVLFCDLVGFTSRAESLDPEDVEAILRPYHARVRSELERHGGTVEKFIGDAVMALFGAPVAHEDDAERAVRAALAIRDFAVEEDLELRVGITTGEALVALDASPAEGEGMASGDVVNTAARLQAAAPINGILADETTYRATRNSIEYDNATDVEAKGKAQPVPVWLALKARARFGVDVAHEARASLVGRDRELRVLRDAFDRARHERIPQLVTIVGVPGMGKSRLVYELSLIADADPELITWRQGRCLAYGEGVTLWALGEIVKAQAGVLEQDAPSDVQTKIHRSVEEALAGSGEEAWVESHLLALVGLADEAELGGDRRNEAFAAWRRFLEALAEQRPLVLAFEDLHWADASLLDFVDELVDWVTDVPLLVVGTARPELLERRPGWGGGKLNTTTLALRPLSDEQTALLIGQLLEKPLIAAESQQALLERAGGNPLYAEQFADLFLERGSIEELPLPETLQGIIAARLDGLADREKGLLQDAAVVGKVFWASALQRDPGNAVGVLHTLERKGFVRRQKRSSLEGESEFAFAHALVRDVAYGQIARSDRAEKHRRTAEWIEGLGRSDDHAELLAHHWRSALELVRAAGRDDMDLSERARLAHRSAGDRAFALNAFAVAETYYSEALALWPPADAERPDLLFRRARALHIGGDERRESALEEARDALVQAGDREGAAEMEAFLSQAAWYRGQRDTAYAHLERAEALVADNEISPAKTRVLCFAARFRMLAGERADASRIAEEALLAAETLALDELRAHALTTMAGSRPLDDPRADDELERALALAIDSPLASTILNNLATRSIATGDLQRADELYAEAMRVAERFGDRVSVRWLRVSEIFMDFFLGRWDDAMRSADEFIAECEAGIQSYREPMAREFRGFIRLARDDVDGALDDHRRALALSRETKDPQTFVPSLASCAGTLAAVGESKELHTVLDELLPIAERHPEYAVGPLGPLALMSGIADLEDDFRRIIEAAPTGPWKEAAIAGLDRDFDRAARTYVETGTLPWEAQARLRAAEQLIEAGREAEGQVELQKALAFYRSVGATFYLRRGEALLAKTG